MENEHSAKERQPEGRWRDQSRTHCGAIATSTLTFSASSLVSTPPSVSPLTPPFAPAASKPAHISECTWPSSIPTKALASRPDAMVAPAEARATIGSAVFGQAARTVSRAERTSLRVDSRTFEDPVNDRLVVFNGTVETRQPFPGCLPKTQSTSEGTFQPRRSCGRPPFITPSAGAFRHQVHLTITPCPLGCNSLSTGT